MSNFTFESVAVAAGSFLSWGPNPGQVVVGKVTSYDAAGGIDFAGGACPQVGLELVSDTYSINKDGERFDHSAGEAVTLTAAQANLKRAILTARLNVGDVVKITFAKTEKTAKGTVKIFEIAVARGAAFTPVQTSSAEAVRPF